MFEGLGLLGLFLSAFISATVIPMSSEGVLAVLSQYEHSWIVLLTVASVGNWLGGMTTYYLGFLGKEAWIQKFLRQSPEKASRWHAKIAKYGALFGVLCWLPIVGDVIALALGVYRVKMWRVAFWMLVGKTARYGVILALLM